MILFIYAILSIIPIVLFGVYEIENSNTNYRYYILGLWFIIYFSFNIFIPINILTGTLP